MLFTRWVGTSLTKLACLNNRNRLGRPSSGAPSNLSMWIVI